MTDDTRTRGVSVNATVMRAVWESVLAVAFDARAQ
jgi:hypothetical protein